MLGILISKLPRRQITVDPNKAPFPLTRGRQRFPGRGRRYTASRWLLRQRLWLRVAPLPRFILPSRPFVKRALLTPSTSEGLLFPSLNLFHSFPFFLFFAPLWVHFARSTSIRCMKRSPPSSGCTVIGSFSRVDIFDPTCYPQFSPSFLFHFLLIT